MNTNVELLGVSGTLATPNPLALELAVSTALEWWYWGTRLLLLLLLLLQGRLV